MHGGPQDTTQGAEGGHQMDRSLRGGEESGFEAQDTTTRESEREKW